MRVFVHEVVKKDGETPYPPNSLYQIVVSIQCYLRENGRPEINFLESPHYDKLCKSLEARMKELTSLGYGIQRKQAQPITRGMESMFWDKGIFSRESAAGLLNIVYFYNCKLFGLRAGDEHRSLCAENYNFGNCEGSLYMQFNGGSNKTYQGGLSHRKLCPKVLKIYPSPELGERDILNCYQLYLSFIPKEGPFYRQPASDGKNLKFTRQVIGKNTLATLVQKFCGEAGFDGHYTGHSGKVTCATELFNNMVDEQLIQHYTGHRSVDSVRAHKRPGDEHFKSVSRILQPPTKAIQSGLPNTHPTSLTENQTVNKAEDKARRKVF